MSVIVQNLKFLVLSASLNSKSRSKQLAQSLYNQLIDQNAAAEFLALGEFNLPPCDGDTAYSQDSVIHLTQKIAEANGILVCSPIYNYDVNSVLKNALELTGSAWKYKVVGLACTAGGQGSYMAPMGFLNSLMLDFRCSIIPQYVYAGPNDVTHEKIVTPELEHRVKRLAKTMVHFTTGLAPHLSVLAIES